MDRYLGKIIDELIALHKYAFSLETRMAVAEERIQTLEMIEKVRNGTPFRDVVADIIGVKHETE